MIPIDFSGKIALVTGVGDNDSFAWHISKALPPAEAKVVWPVNTRMQNIVESILSSTRDDDVQSRVLPHGAGTLAVDKVIPCDVSYDTLADVEEKVRTDRRY